MVELNKDTIITSVFLSNDIVGSENSRALTGYVINKESHAIDIFDWSSEKIFACVELHLEKVFNTTTPPKFTLMTNRG
jgi:hypothetical protein